MPRHTIPLLSTCFTVWLTAECSIKRGVHATLSITIPSQKIGLEGQNKFFQLIPSGRLGEPSKYAALAVFLASGENYCVGQTISSNGGYVI